MSSRCLQFMVFYLSVNGVAGYLALNGVGKSRVSAGGAFSASRSAASSVPVLKDQQEVVDEYLEFLDRRYRRFNAKKDDSIHLPKLDWLRQTSSFLSQDNSDVNKKTQSQCEEDALYVLGVAGMASRRLLQKHHLLDAVPTNDGFLQAPSKAAYHQDSIIKDKSAIITDVSSCDVVEVPPMQQASGKVASVVLTAIRTAKLQRRLFIRSFNRKLSAATRSLLKSPVVVSKRLWKMGGGTNSTKFTLKLAITAGIILGPILKEVLSETVISA